MVGDEVGLLGPGGSILAQIFFSVTSADQDAARFHGVGQGDIAVTIADYKRTAQIQLMLASGALQQTWLGLTARALVFGRVRAIVDRVEMRARGVELPGHEFVDRMHHRFWKHAAGYTRLIRDDDCGQPSIV